MLQATSTVSCGEAGLEGALALPEEAKEAEGGERVGGVVLVHEWWGVNANIQAQLARLASAGFLALAPNLYRVPPTTDREEASRRMGALDWPQALKDLEAAAAFLRAHPRCNGKVAVMGFCMGGALTFAAAASVPGLSAVVPFYGLPDVEATDWSKVRAPIQAHFARQDAWAKASSAEALRERLQAQGQSMELFVYDAQHAFANETRPEVYSPADASLALQRTTDFLRAHLA